MQETLAAASWCPTSWKVISSQNFGKQFEYFAEVNFERNKAIKTFFQGDIDVRLIAKKSAVISISL